MERINVTKTFLPPIEEYETYLRQIWDSNQLTNHGPLLRQFEQQIKQRLSVEHFQFVSNGTSALQLALRALGITEGEVITTPFSYVATTSSILWEHCEPVFVDIEPDTFCIDPDKIEAAITPRTKAIMPVHVFGYPCDTDRIEAIAKAHNLKVIYDAAHAFGVTYQGRSLFDYGDISVGSFHATKLFHTIEGGGLVARDKTVDENIEITRRFGHTWDEHFSLGINAKASEFQAAMGLCNLQHIDANIAAHKALTEQYDTLLGGTFYRPKPQREFDYNYAYYPIILDSETQLQETIKRLEAGNIFPRRYFYPSLNTLPYIEKPQSCPVSEDIALRILCLPLYVGLEPAAVENVCRIIKQ